MIYSHVHWAFLLFLWCSFCCCFSVFCCTSPFISPSLSVHFPTPCFPFPSPSLFLMRGSISLGREGPAQNWTTNLRNTSPTTHRYAERADYPKKEQEKNVLKNTTVSTFPSGIFGTTMPTVKMSSDPAQGGSWPKNQSFPLKERKNINQWGVEKTTTMQCSHPTCVVDTLLRFNYNIRLTRPTGPQPATLSGNKLSRKPWWRV